MKMYSALLLLLLGSCQKYSLSVSQLEVNERNLASSHIGSPDPHQKHPPMGQRLIAEWVVPREFLDQEPILVLHLIYWDYTEAKITFPIKYMRGYKECLLVDEEYEQKKGLLTYKAEILDSSGQLYRDWKHQLWVKLITAE